MDRARWRDRVSLPSLLLAALLSTAFTPAAISAGLKSRLPASTDCGAITPTAAARSAAGPVVVRGQGPRVQPLLGARGDLTGRVLRVESAAGAQISVTLPAESFVGHQVGDLIVYTHYSPGSGSEVHAINVANGCDVRLASPPEIVRSASIDPSGSSLYVHTVARSSRADGGVALYDLTTGKPTQVVPPLRPSERLGPIFGTDLRWSMDGSALAVQSCGAFACLTRVLEVASGAVTSLDGPGQGAFIALTNEHLVTFADCAGLPCAVLSTDIATGSTSVIADDTNAVDVQPSGSAGASLLITTAAGTVEVVQ
jgi:hypothetical protein